MKIFVLLFLGLCWAGVAGAASARDGDGTLAVSPAATTAGSTDNSFTFSFRNENHGDYRVSSRLALIVPAGWTAPQITVPGNPGYVSIVSTAGTATASILSVTGASPWTVTVNFTADKGTANGFNLGYAGGGTKVTAPGTTGTYAFVAQTKHGGGTLVSITASPVIAVAKGNQTITFPPIGSQLTTNKAGLSATARSGLGVTFAVGSGPGSISGNTNLVFAGAGQVSIVASQAGNGNWNPAPAVTQAFAVAKAVAAVTLNPLSQTYDGTARVVTATTVPGELAVVITYDGSATAPALAGSYAVTGTVNSSMYQGQQVGTLVVSKALATVTLGELAQTYDGMARVVTVTTVPAGLTVGITYNGSATPPVATGSYAVVATVADASYTGTATGTLVVSKIPATVTLDGLAQTYDGAAREVTATTVPAGLTVDITYNGSETPPVDAGTYAVVATVANVTYEGSVLGTLVVGRAVADIALENLEQVYDGTPKAVTAVTEPEDLPVEVIYDNPENGPAPAGRALADGPTYDGPATPPIDAGSYVVVAIVDDANYEGLTSSTLVVAKAAAEIALENLQQVYDGAAKSATVTTTPAELPVELTYNGLSMAPAVAGSYAVDAMVDDVNYDGSAYATLVVAKATAEITLANLSQNCDGEPRGVTATTRPEGLSVEITYDGSVTAPTTAGTYVVVATINDADYEGSATGTLVTARTCSNLKLKNLSQVYDGTPKCVEPETTPAGLAVEITYNGSLAAPIDAGIYAVTAIVTDVHYMGFAIGTQVVMKADQTIDFPAINDRVAGDAVGLKATASSGLPVAFAVGSGPGSISGGTNLSFSGTGTVSIVASQSGTPNWNPAPTAIRTFNVLPVLAPNEFNVNVRENGEGRFFVRLDQAPAASTTATVTRSAGDVDLTVKSGATLVFTPANWSSWQAVTLAAKDDADAANGMASFQIVIPGSAPKTANARELDDDIGANLALASSGSTISGGSKTTLVIDGIHTTNTNYGYVNSTNVPAGTMMLDLKMPTVVSRMRLLNWDWDNRFHRYKIESSLDGTTWSNLVDASSGAHQGWEDWPVDGTARYLRFTGLSNSANALVCIAEWEVYGNRMVPGPVLVTSLNSVNVRENGEGRFFVKLDQAPAASTTATVARSTGDADLSVKSGATLVFTPTNWSTWQAATLAAADDGDSMNGTATISIEAPGLAPKTVTARELDDDVGANLALASSGSTIAGGFKAALAIDGIHTTNTNYSYVNSTNVPPGTMTLDLKVATGVSRVRLLNWDWIYRIHRYKIESSLNGTNWSLLVDASSGAHQGWEDWPVNGTARYLRFTGLSNSANALVCIAEWEVYGMPVPVVSTTQVNVRENGEGRFYVKLDRAPTVNTAVTVTRSAGDMDLRVKDGATLTFTPANWSSWQVATLGATDDTDAANETATISIAAPGAAPKTVTAMELDDDIGTNLALASRGSTITGGSLAARTIDGIHTTNSNYGYMNSTNVPPGTMTLDLKVAQAVSRVRLLNWDWDYRIHRYQIESSLNGTNWSLLVDASSGAHQGWEDWAVNGTARYLRFTGLSNSANALVCIAEWEVYGMPVPVVSATQVNVRENGEGRFFVRLDRAPATDTAVTVTRSGGNANLGIQSGAALTFTPANWSSWQAVTLTAANDADVANGTAAFQVVGPGLAPQTVTAMELDDDIGENLALASSGSTITDGWAPYQLIDGIHTESVNCGYTDCSSVPAGTMTLDLKAAMTVSRIRLLNWDWNHWVQRYKIESSLDGTTWSLLADASAESHQGWDDWAVADQPIRYLRFTGLWNSAGRFGCIAEWEVYGTRPVARRSPGSAAKGESIASVKSGSMTTEIQPVTVVTSDGPEDESGWAAVDGDPETAWVGQKAGGGYIVLEYAQALQVKSLEVDLAEDSLTDIQYLYSMDGQDWQPLPDDMEENPVSLKFLWLLFSGDENELSNPNVVEIYPQQ